jgi:hypothetical protein
LYEQVVCGQIVCERVVCGQVVCEQVVGGGGGGAAAGVQNQKQEPHIKMWGKNNQFKQTSNKSDKVKKQQYNQENKTHTINKKTNSSK